MKNVGDTLLLNLQRFSVELVPHSVQALGTVLIHHDLSLFSDLSNEQMSASHVMIEDI